MGNLFQELKRRKVIRVAAVYAIVAWLIIQVAGEILPTFNAPQWVNQTIVLLLMLGFPLAIVLAWALEITSEGIKADAGAASPPRSLNARMIVVKVSPLLCLAIAALLYSKIASAQGPDDSYSLIQSVYSEAGGYFMGDASDDLSLIAIAGYSNSSLGLEESNLTFFNSDGQILNRVHIGGGSWAVATTPDGAWTAVGSENEQLYLFEDTQLRWSGRPIAGNTQIRGVAISNDGRYVASGGARITIHDLTADDPIDPIFADNAETEQIRAVDIAAEGRYIAWGGRTTTSKMYMGVYDLELDEKVFVDEIEYGGEINAELRQISISPDGNRIVGGDWAGFVHYWVRNTGSDTWERVESIEVGSRVYWTDMDESGTVVIIGFQGHGPRLYELGDSSLTLLWSANEGVDGGQRSIAITPNGE